MHEPSDFSFLQHDELWDENEDIKQKIHNLIEDGEGVLVSLEHKIKRSDYLIREEYKKRSFSSFRSFTSPRNMRIRKLRAQRLDHILRAYWEWLLDRLHYECQICHLVFNPGDLEVDHCRPLALGGKNEWHNIQPLCAACNRKKNAKEFFSESVLAAQKAWEEIAKETLCQKKP